MVLSWLPVPGPCKYFCGLQRPSILLEVIPLCLPKIVLIYTEVNYNINSCWVLLLRGIEVSTAGWLALPVACPAKHKDGRE